MTWLREREGRCWCGRPATWTWWGGGVAPYRYCDAHAAAARQILPDTGRGRKRMQRVELHCHEPGTEHDISHASRIPAEWVDFWLDTEAEAFFAAGGWVEVWCADRGLRVFDRDFRDVAAVRAVLAHAAAVCAETFGDEEEGEPDAAE